MSFERFKVLYGVIYGDTDLPTAYNLAKQIQVVPLAIRQPDQ